jgi:hypothetical protein
MCWRYQHWVKHAFGLEELYTSISVLSLSSFCRRSCAHSRCEVHVEIEAEESAEGSGATRVEGLLQALLRSRPVSNAPFGLLAFSGSLHVRQAPVRLTLVHTYGVTNLCWEKVWKEGPLNG